VAFIEHDMTGAGSSVDCRRAVANPDPERLAQFSGGELTVAQ
jgi:hypothetical protein